jgi:glutathione peroxidase
MKIVLMILGVMIVVGVAVAVLTLRSAMAGGEQPAPAVQEGVLWDFTSRTLEGEPAPLDDWRGQVVLVVNVASKCGLTPQYTGLEKLYRDRKDQGFAVLAFPANDFMGQEPGSPAEIRQFCSSKYDVTFPMFEKVTVKGDGKCEIYRWLTAGGLEEPSWNFTKYLVGRDGKVIARFGPRTAPDDADLAKAIKQALAAPAP